MSKSLPAVVILLLCARPSLGQSVQSDPAARSQASNDAGTCSLAARPSASAETPDHPFDSKSAFDSESAAELSARLAAAYNQQADAVHTVVAALQLVATPGPSYGDQAKQTQEVDALV